MVSFKTSRYLHLMCFETLIQKHLLQDARRPLVTDRKIYTRKGDRGETSLLGGQRVPKHDERVEAYGTLDELNGHIGLLRDLSKNVWIREILVHVEDRLFAVEAVFAAANSSDIERLPKLLESDVDGLEQAIDKMNETLPSLSNFVLPGGNVANSFAHIARAVCRRAERCVSRVAFDHTQCALALRYINRLSDFLFVLARKFSCDAGTPEICWNPKENAANSRS